MVLTFPACSGDLAVPAGVGLGDGQAERLQFRHQGPQAPLVYYISAGTMVREDSGPAVPELARRMTLTSCHLDPARAMVPVLQRLAASGVPLGDVLDDSGYAHRVP